MYSFLQCHLLHMSFISHVSVSLNRRQSTSQRRWRKQRRSWKKIHMTSTLGAYWFVKHRFSDTGLHSFLPGVTCFGRERGSLTAHLMLFHVNGLWDVPYDSVCKLILLLLESTHRQSKEDIWATCRPVSQFGQILEAIHWSWGYTLF